MSRGEKKRKQMVATCTTCSNRVGTRYVYNASKMLAGFKELFKRKFCRSCRQRTEVKYKEEKHSS